TTKAEGAGESFLYETVMNEVALWGTPGNLMFVVGATKAEQLQSIRQKFPDYFFLVPGVGFQGGSLEEVSKAALTKDGGILVNASRAIIYAGKGENFAEEAAVVASEYAQEMKQLLLNPSA
ncbi:MAG: orotidine 5'-phosphate decarboxylase, partial [Segetibacter sp.]